MLKKGPGCAGCALVNISTGFASPEGDGTLGVLVIGESLGFAESQDGLPFRPRGESGAVLERAWRRLGLTRQQFRITNVVMCQPPGNKLEGCSYKLGAISHCKATYLDQVVREMKPRAILALGGVATEVLTGMKGRKQGVTSVRGYVLDCQPYPGIPVIPSLHPAFLRRGKMSWLGVLINDIALAAKVAKHGRPTDDIIKLYQPQASVEDLREFYERAAAVGTTIAYDIETQWSGGEDEHELVVDSEVEEGEDTLEPAKPAIQDGDPILVQFSLASGTGIAVPPTGDYLPWIQRILALPNPKIGFNSRGFDDGKLAGIGCPVLGQKDDIMLAWHHLQPDLPRSLQAVASFYCPEFGPWKHESGIDLARYGVKDVDVLHRIWEPLQKDLRARDLWRGYERHVRNLIPILDRMSERGLPLDAEEQRRFEAFLDEGLATSDARMQKIVPDSLRLCNPKEGYVKTPEDTGGMQLRGFIADLAVVVVRQCDCVDLETGEIAGWTKKVATRCPICKGTGIASKSKDKVTAPVTRWCRLEPFKPSSQQLISYMHYKGHKVPKAIGEDRESTAKIFLERMGKETKDPLYPAVLEYRAMQKMKGSYLWSYGQDHRIHPTFTFSPASGQLAAVRPNCFSADTEVLTNKGWKLFPQLRKEDLVAQYDTADGSITLAKPTAYVENHFLGELRHISSEQSIDLMVTPEHDCLLRNRKTGTFSKVKAQGYLKDSQQIHAGWLAGGTLAYSKSQLALICALQADGSVDRRGALDFSFKRQRKIERFDWVLAQHGVVHTKCVNESTGRVRYRIHQDHVPLWLKDKKFFSDWVLMLDAISMAGLVDEALLWDGSQRCGAYYSTVKSNVDWIQLAAALTGRRAHYFTCGNDGRKNIVHAVGIAQRYDSSATAVATNEPVPYDGYVYCVSMPLGTVVVRRNNRIHITGNCMTIPAPKGTSWKDQLAVRFRKTIAARPGYVLLEVDMSGFHTSTFALEARDEHYFRLANKLRDPHSFLAAVMLGLKKPEQMLAMEDEELVQFFKWVKKNHKFIRDGQAKPAILGFALGLGGNKLYEQNRYDPDTLAGFRSKGEAERLVQTLRGCFPKCYEYQIAVRQLAHDQRFLYNKHGFIRWFWDVLYIDPRTGQASPGEQAEAAIAFNVQCDAHGILKDALLRLEARGLLERYGLANIVHDSVVFEVERGLLEEAMYEVVAEMQKPSMVLSDTVLCPGGLVIAAEAKHGPNLAEMETH